MSETQGLKFDAEILDDLQFFVWCAKNLPLRFFGDEVLHATCKPVLQREFGTKPLQQTTLALVDCLTRFREYSGLGRGLAANQIGFSKRIIVVWFDDQPLVMVNPRMTSSNGAGSFWESCMSAGAFLIGEVHRPWEGTFEYQDLEGTPHTFDADEMQTRIMLHEIDHLDGIVCSDKYEPKTMRFVRGGREEIQRLGFKKLV